MGQRLPLSVLWNWKKRGKFIRNICCLTKNFFPVFLRALQSLPQHAWARPRRRARREGRRRNPSPAPTAPVGDVAPRPRGPGLPPQPGGQWARERRGPRLPSPRPGARPSAWARGGRWLRGWPVPSPAPAPAPTPRPPLSSLAPFLPAGRSLFPTMARGGRRLGLALGLLLALALAPRALRAKPTVRKERVVRPDSELGERPPEDNQSFQYDHEAFLGKEDSKTFDQLTSEESKERLG